VLPPLIHESSLHVLMEGAPSNINTKDIIKTIKKFKEVKNIHDNAFNPLVTDQT
jgi:Co/Zn/Cd efflux system component